MSVHKNLNDLYYAELEKIRAEEKQGIGDLVGDFTGFSTVGIMPKRTVSTFLQKAVGWVYACIDAISNEIGAMEITLFQEKNGEVEQIKDHAILDLLARANNNTTEFDLFYLTQQYLELVGEAPWFLEFQNGVPTNILLLRPDRLDVLPPKEDGQIIGGFKYRVFKDAGVQEITLEPEEVIFLKYPDPVRIFRGKGTLEAAILTVDIDDSAEKFDFKFFQNSATPDSALTTDKKLSPEVKEKIKQEIRRRHEGLENAHKTIILESGLQWKPMALSQREMDFIETMKFTRDKILAIFRVPKSVLGLTEDVNRANAEAGDFVFAKRTIKPKMKKLVQMLNEFLVPLFDDTGTLFLSFEDPVPENVELKLQTAKEGVVSGYLTPNEARGLLGFDPIDGGDDVLTPATPQVPPSKLSELKGQDSKRLKVKKEIDKTAHRANRKRYEKERKAKYLKKVLKNTVAKKISQIVQFQLLTATQKKKSIKKKTLAAKKAYTGKREEKIEFQTEQLRVGEEFEKSFINRQNRLFRSQEEKFQEMIGAKQETDPRLTAQLDVGEETLNSIKAMTPIVSLTITEQSRKTFQLLGQSNILTANNNEVVAEYLEKQIFRFSKDVTVETNAIVGKVLANSVREGDSIAQTSRKLSKTFKDMEQFRSERIARSEIIRATSVATEESFVVSEVVEAKEWLTFIDERTDQECLDLNGKVLGLGKNYFDRGDEFGRFSLNYEDISGPPLHVNCRCTLVPVVIA